MIMIHDDDDDDDEWDMASYPLALFLGHNGSSNLWVNHRSTESTSRRLHVPATLPGAVGCNLPLWFGTLGALGGMLDG